jgi:hypothetical protein
MMELNLSSVGELVRYAVRVHLIDVALAMACSVPITRIDRSSFCSLTESQST